MYPPEVGTVGASSSVNIDNLDIVQIADGVVEVSVEIHAMSLVPDGFVVTAYKLLGDGGSVSGDIDAVIGPIDSPTNPITISGLASDEYYKFVVYAYTDLYGRGNESIISSYHISANRSNLSVISTGIDPLKISAGKSYLTLTNSDISGKKWVTSLRSFSAIDVIAGDTYSISGPNGVSSSVKKYPSAKYQYYSFGTTLFMDSNYQNPQQGAGIGFFVNATADLGYYLVVDSTSLSASEDNKSIRIVKVSGKQITVLKDSQISKETVLDGVYGGKSYALDIKVKVYELSVDIVAYVNGFKITATDTTNYDSTSKIFNQIISPTQNVTILCTKGKSAFDYVYATSMTEKKYNDSLYNLNQYQGQFSDDILNTAYGDILYNANNSTVTPSTKVSIDEFGTTVREIVKQSIRFPSRPSYPVKWSTGSNNLAKIIGSKVSNFGAEAYVLNNASTTIPLSDGNLTSFYLVGYTLAPSGTLEYTTDELSDYVNKEPVIFESKWLQSVEEVKALATWIKDTVINRGKIVTINVFGNPLISVGDIINIKYLQQGFLGTEKFTVTSVSHTYNNGLETAITCRTL